MKRGVLTTETFMYVFVIIVIALILVFGARAIYKFNETKQLAIYTQFKTDFENAVSDVYTKNEGTTIIYSSDSSHKPLLVPNSIQNICFEDIEDINYLYFDPPKYQRFPVGHLVASEDPNLNFNGCIPIKNKKFSFKLVNEVENGETIVRLYPTT